MTPNELAISIGTGTQPTVTPTPVLLEHRPVIHLVNMITGQHQRVTAVLCRHEVQILEDGIRGARVPSRMNALLRRPHLEELTRRARQEVPATIQVRDQAVCLVLSQNSDSTHAGIDAVRQCEVDVTEMACEWDCGLALPLRQLAETCSIATRKDQCKRVARQLPHFGPPPCVFFVGAEGAQAAYPRQRTPVGGGRRDRTHSPGEASHAAR
jgi:hypothetical protein